MNYQRIYNEIIEHAKLRGLNKKKLDYYTERHHIVPRCLNGNNKSDNLVLLTGREHYLCHWLLWKIHKDNTSLFYAFNFISFGANKRMQRNSVKFTSKQYEDLKALNSELVSNKMKGRIFSDHTKALWSQNRKGKRPSEETKKKLKQSFEYRDLTRMYTKCTINDINFKCKKDAVEYAMKNLGYTKTKAYRAFNNIKHPNFKCETRKRIGT